MKERKGKVAMHNWDLHECLKITEKHKSCRYPAQVDNVDGTIYLQGNLIIKGVDFCQVLLNSSCFTFIKHLLC